MKKKNVINLIKYHVDGNDKEFRGEAYEIARSFEEAGDKELARYVMALLSGVNAFSPQSVDEHSEFFVEVGNPSNSFKIPLSIERDIMGIVNAVSKKSSVNRFLFVGDSGTGKTEAAKQIARILDRELYSVQFDRIVDSKLGQTSKNLIQVFDDINSLSNPEKVIILFDEIDAIALDRVNSNDLREMGRVTSTLLKEFDRINDSVLLIATTNLYRQFDKALLRRFDFTVNFNRYSKDDLSEVADEIVKSELRKYEKIKLDLRILHKIYNLADTLPYPGNLKNVIRSAIAFSDLENEYGYLAKIYETLLNRRPADDLKMLQEQGFTVREIEKLTGVPKSSVARGIDK